ncbi:DUF3299 domain-containing protein [Henriciella sp. AS95]|uniref:DUF3299 domain-containing protein n=1 Tax=Henriciella sp. AS95 TaxID=3135782 RepID=UPI0031708612
MAGRCLAALLVITSAGCGDRALPAAEAPANRVTKPPPIPDGRENVGFEKPEAATQETANSETQASDDAPAAESSMRKYWGVKEGEPLRLVWEDLLPEGAEAELARQQAEFYEMLEKRYAAQSTSLMDAQPFGEIAEGSDMDYMPQLGTFDVVDDLDGEFIRIPGYIVPFDFDESRKHTEFLLVPYMGACIHTPPPPPNQVIFVRADPAVKIGDIWSPYWLEGTILTEKNQNAVGDAAYTLDLTELEPYRDR